MYEYYNKNREQDQFIWKGKYFLPWWLFGFGHFWCNQAIIDKVMQRRKDCQGGLRNLLLSSNWWRTWSWYYYAYLGWNSQKSGKRDHARIVPTGSYAQHVLGLSTQIPLNCVYMTDGSARHLELYNGRKITFKRTTPKNLSFTSKLAMLITFALKSLGKINIEQTVIKRIRELLKNEPKSEVMKDLSLMPEWIRNIVTEAYE